MFWGIPYIIYGREKDFLLSVFRTVFFLRNSIFFVPFPIFQICYIMVFAMRTDLLLLLSWYKRRSNKKKKSRLRLRAYSGKAVLALKNELASLHYAQTAFFSAARPFLSYAHAPTTRPVFLFTPRRFAVGSLFRLCLAFGFYYLVLYTFTFTTWNTYQYRIKNSVFSHGILYT